MNNSVSYDNVPLEDSISIACTLGCDKKCAFCADDSLDKYQSPFEVVSIPYETILTQIRASNKKYICLTTSHLDLYNYNKMNIVQLYKLAKMTFPNKCIFPGWLQPSSKLAKEIIPLAGTSDVNISAYSMDNNVLKAMKVGHTREDVFELIDVCKMHNKHANVAVIDGCHPQSYFSYLKSQKELKSDKNVSWTRLKYHKRGNATQLRSFWYALACDVTKLFKLKTSMRPESPTISTSKLLTYKNVDLLIAMFSMMMDFSGQVPEYDDRPSEEQLTQFFSMMHLLHIPQDALPQLKDYKIKNSIHTLKSLYEHVKQNITSVISTSPMKLEENENMLEYTIKRHGLLLEYNDKKLLT